MAIAVHGQERIAMSVEPEAATEATDATVAAKAAKAAANVSLPADTTGEQDRNTAGRRGINLMWESTQAVIALAVIFTGMATASILALRTDASDASKSVAITAFLLISNTVFLVIGFYFGRTNHERQGGVVNGQGGSR
jgi:hypothetical protein